MQINRPRWLIYLLWLFFIIGLLEGVVGIFDVPPYSRRLTLLVLATAGGLVILVLSFLPPYRNKYHTWDRGLTSLFLVLATFSLAWLTYHAIPNNLCPRAVLDISPEQVTPGEIAILTVQATDQESDALNYSWEATEPGLQNQGGPYSSPRNEYVPPTEVAGKTVRITATVDDHQCGQQVSTSAVVRVLLLED